LRHPPRHRRPPCPRGPTGGRLGNGRAKRGEVSLLQLHPSRTALESVNHGRWGWDFPPKLFWEPLWHNFVGNICQSCSRSYAKGTLTPIVKQFRTLLNEPRNGHNQHIPGMSSST
jgi:hypothetical protein